MKITVEVADGLFHEAKASAGARGVPLRRLVEEGLRLVVERERQPKARFKLRDGSFRGDGMVADFTWPEIRAMIYEGRGGSGGHDRG